MATDDHERLHDADGLATDDREAVLEDVKKCGMLLGCVTGGLDEDPEVVVGAVRQDGRALQFAGITSKSSRWW